MDIHKNRVEKKLESPSKTKCQVSLPSPLKTTKVSSPSKFEQRSLDENTSESALNCLSKISSQNPTEVTIRTSSRISERKKRILEKSLLLEATDSLENENEGTKPRKATKEV